MSVRIVHRRSILVSCLIKARHKIEFWHTKTKVWIRVADEQFEATNLCLEMIMVCLLDNRCLPFHFKPKIMTDRKYTEQYSNKYPAPALNSRVWQRLDIRSEGVD